MDGARGGGRTLLKTRRSCGRRLWDRHRCRWICILLKMHVSRPGGEGTGVREAVPSPSSSGGYWLPLPLTLEVEGTYRLAQEIEFHPLPRRGVIVKPASLGVSDHRKGSASIPVPAVVGIAMIDKGALETFRPLLPPWT